MVDLAHVVVGDPLPAALNEERDAINLLSDELETKITLPGGLATGDLLRWDGTKIVSTDTRFFEGTGNPNGKVAAPVGSRYIDKNGTRGAVEWVKSADGDSNTGWFSSVGPLAPTGQVGTITISGAAAKTKTRTVPLDAAIFLGAAPRYVIVSSSGPGGDVAHPWVISKAANAFNVGVRNLDNVNFTAASTYAVDFFAVI